MSQDNELVQNIKAEEKEKKREKLLASFVKSSIEVAESEGKGWVLSGYPTSPEQAESLSKAFVVDLILESVMTTDQLTAQLKQEWKVEEADEEAVARVKSEVEKCQSQVDSVMAFFEQPEEEDGETVKTAGKVKRVKVGDKQPESVLEALFAEVRW